jgi:hypothetical protein
MSDVEMVLSMTAYLRPWADKEEGVVLTYVRLELLASYFLHMKISLGVIWYSDGGGVSGAPLFVIPVVFVFV